VNVISHQTAGRIAHTITTVAAWAISTVRPLAQVQLTDAECEAAGVPYGSTEPAVSCWPVVGANRWRVDVWSDGEGCVNVDVLGWHGEVHFTPATKRPAVVL